MLDLIWFSCLRVGGLKCLLGRYGGTVQYLGRTFWANDYDFGQDICLDLII
jgi:hypothetical protein